MEFYQSPAVIFSKTLRVESACARNIAVLNKIYEEESYSSCNRVASRFAVKNKTKRTEADRGECENGE
jgi:hypothetical protein